MAKGCFSNWLDARHNDLVMTVIAGRLGRCPCHHGASTESRLTDGGWEPPIRSHRSPFLGGAVAERRVHRALHPRLT
jgi:hypothetical protein